MSIRVNYTEGFSPLVENFDVADDFAIVVGSFLHSHAGMAHMYNVHC